MRNTWYLILAAVVCMTTACKANYPGPMEDPAPQVDVVSVSSVNEAVSGLKDGYYDLTTYVRGTEGCRLAVYADNRCSAVLLSENVWTPLRIRGIRVENGQLTLHSEAADSVTFSVQGTSLTPGKACTFISGGDMSMLSRVEKVGGKYYDAEGKEQDAFTLMAANGMNLARLRLYNDPGNRKYSPSKQMYQGIEDEADILSLAQRAKAAGMQIELTFHYSDYWTNGGEQHKPHEWKDYTMAQLDSAMYAYTHAFLTKMVAQGTAPEYVSLGNEIQSGILFGTIDADNLPTDSINGYCSDMKNLARLLGQGAKAVREVCPEAKIILHLTTSDAIGLDHFKWFCGAMQDYGMDYDVIGASYYPYYGGQTVETMCGWADYLIGRFDKDFIFMETGFAWTPKLADGNEGQIANNGPYEMTREAQSEFLFALSSRIREISSGRCLGYIYWDPIYYDVNGKTGWINGGKNVTGNSTLVDFTGKILPAMEALKYNN